MRRAVRALATAVAALWASLSFASLGSDGASAEAPVQDAVTTSGTVTETCTYDEGEKLTQVAYSDSTPTRSFTYDDAGRLTAEHSGSTQTRGYTYDYDDRLVTMTGGFGTRNFGYNGRGARVATGGTLVGPVKAQTEVSCRPTGVCASAYSVGKSTLKAQSSPR